MLLPLIHLPKKMTYYQKYNIVVQDNVAEKSCDAIIVSVAHSQYRNTKPSELIQFCKNPTTAVIGDLKSLYNKIECEEVGFETFRL